MRKQWMLAVSPLLGLTLVVMAGAAHLPEGPIADRHELMEGLGKDAKAIKRAAKSEDAKAAAAAGKRIQEAAKKITGLFPKGSTHPKSRAKAEIWDDWDNFVERVEALESAAANVVQVAEEGGNLGTTTGPFFKVCKGCHDEFRVPKKHKKHKKK